MAKSTRSSDRGTRTAGDRALRLHTRKSKTERIQRQLQFHAAGSLDQNNISTAHLALQNFACLLGVYCEPEPLFCNARFACPVEKGLSFSLHSDDQRDACRRGFLSAGPMQLCCGRSQFEHLSGYDDLPLVSLQVADETNHFGQR